MVTINCSISQSRFEQLHKQELQEKSMQKEKRNDLVVDD